PVDGSDAGRERFRGRDVAGDGTARRIPVAREWVREVQRVEDQGTPDPWTGQGRRQHARALPEPDRPGREPSGAEPTPSRVASGRELLAELESHLGPWEPGPECVICRSRRTQLPAC